ncbi:MAG: hypothetical protein CVT63_07770, partial [Candidatus Anoxymicrobium japonicum]
ECEIEGARVTDAAVRRVASPRNVELAFKGVTPVRGADIASHICARSGVHHAAAFCEAVEDALGVTVLEEQAALRVVILEWARIASHLEVVSDVARALEDDLACGPPRRYVAQIRSTFDGLFSNPFAFGAVVPGGVEIRGGPGAFDSLDEMAPGLARNTRFWARKLGLSKARLSDGRLAHGALPEDHPPATAFRACGSKLDFRAGEEARGFYHELGYRPVVREGGAALDRVLLLLGEVDASLALIEKAKKAASACAGGPTPVVMRKSSGVGACESPHGGIEYRVFLGAEGKILRVRIASAADVVVGLAGQALAGVPFEDAAPALTSLNLCASCANA